MKAITNTGPNQLEWLDWPLPQPQQGQVRIHTGACGICATDLHMIAGWTRTGYPSIPGHEWAGTVDAIGVGVNHNLIGLRCVGENVLTAGGEVGFEIPGGYGEYFLTDAANLYPIPDDFPMITATLMEPLAVSLRAVRKLDMNGRNSALIMGDGPIGLLVLILMKHAGMKDIFLVGGREPHLSLAEELGARQTLNYHPIQGNLATAVIQAAGQTFPIVVEASGSQVAMQACLDLVHLCGQVLVLGDYGDTRARFKWNHLLHQEIEIIGSNASAGAWSEAVQLAVVGNLALDRLVMQRLPTANFLEGFKLARSRRGDVVKVVLDWNS